MPSSYGWRCAWVCTVLVAGYSHGFAQDTKTSEAAVKFRDYSYEIKPDGEAFRRLNPRKAPQPGPLLLKKGDRLAICGDSITEQKMYSRIIETYLTVCEPDLEITVRQFGWSGEKTDGFLNRMDQDCLRFEPTIATLCYGMNDSRYRPFDVTNGMWYEDHYRAIVRKFKDAGARVIVGSPGCAGKIASWVESGTGTLEEHNQNLCALRDIAINVAESEEVRFADVFWPMYQAQVFAPGQHGATAETPYYVAGEDGIHPDWAGHVVMAYAFLKAMGLDGQIGEFTIDTQSGSAQASAGHTIQAAGSGKYIITSDRYPFCARGPLDQDDSIRSGMTLVPFAEDLNRFILKVSGLNSGTFQVTWGKYSQEFTSDGLSNGVNLAVAFPENPFSAAFDTVDRAVAAKQKFETTQIKEIFHGAAGKADIEKAVAETEVERGPLAEAIRTARVPVTHQIVITAVDK